MTDLATPEGAKEEDVLTRSGMLTLVLLLAGDAVAATPPPVRGRAVVASDSAEASRCGEAALAQGGNAVDAVVAAALCAGVVQPAGSGLGGGGFALVQRPGAPPVAYDFREVAPAAAHRDLYNDVVRADGLPPARVGGLAVAVPGESRGLAGLHEAHGRLPLARVVRPAVVHARRGFHVGPHLARALGRVSSHDVAAELGVDGVVASEGDLLRRTELARTLRRFGATRGEDLHTGRGAAQIVARVQADGGILTLDDLAAYAPVVREPVVLTWRGHTVSTMPLPSSGGVILAQLLKAVDGAAIDGMEHNSAAYLHFLSHIMQASFADRAHFLGDADFGDIPIDELLEPARVQRMLDRFDPQRALPASAYAPEKRSRSDAGTQHISVIDADGMAASLTTTINTTFGSRLVAAGVFLNDEMDDFTARPGEPNHYGLMQSDFNTIEAGKRPLSSMCPTILANEEGQPVVAIGASGGPFILSSTFQVLLNMVVFGMDPAAAVAAPRIHHNWIPDRLVVEGELSPDTVAGLKDRGHEIVVYRRFSAAQVVAVQPDGLRAGASDPSKGGMPAATW